MQLRYYGWAFVGTAVRHSAWFSVTARMTPRVHAAIIIDSDRREAIAYVNAAYEENEQRWVSDAEVAKVPCVASLAAAKPNTCPAVWPFDA